jgi:hypothetical protein
MGILNKLFSSKKEPAEPDNSTLLQLLDIYWKSNGEGDSYKNVVLELMNGNSFLMFPVAGDPVTKPGVWEKTETSTRLQIMSMVVTPELKAIRVFTDEELLFNWMKKTVKTVSMRAQDVLAFCERSGISRIIINNGAPNTFVLIYAPKEPEKYSIPENTVLRIGSLNNPLPQVVIERLVEQFKRLDFIIEVYQYGQSREKQFSIVLAFSLSDEPQDADMTILQIVQDALGDERPEHDVDIFIIDGEDSYQRIKDIQDGLIYRK